MPNYEWADNRIKLQAVLLQLKEAQKKDPSLVITDEAVKNAYIARGGKVLSVTEPTPVVEVTNVTEEIVKPVVEVKKGKKGKNK